MFAQQASIFITTSKVASHVAVRQNTSHKNDAGSRALLGGLLSFIFKSNFAGFISHQYIFMAI